MKTDDLPPLNLNAIEPIRFQSPPQGWNVRTQISSLVGLSLLTIYTCTLVFSLSLFFLPIELKDPSRLLLFASLGISSLFFLLLWISFAFERFPLLSIVSLRLVCVSMIFYGWMSIPVVRG